MSDEVDTDRIARACVRVARESPPRDPERPWLVSVRDPWHREWSAGGTDGFLWAPFRCASEQEATDEADRLIVTLDWLLSSGIDAGFELPGDEEP